MNLLNCFLISSSDIELFAIWIYIIAAIVIIAVIVYLFSYLKSFNNNLEAIRLLLRDLPDELKQSELEEDETTKCSQCGTIFKGNYCPGCGADRSKQ